MQKATGCLPVIYLLLIGGAFVVWRYAPPDKLDYIAAAFFALLFLKAVFGLLMARVAVRRVGRRQVITGSVIKIAMWGGCFLLAAIGLLNVHFRDFQLRPSDYVIAFVGGMVGLHATFMADFKILDEGF